MCTMRNTRMRIYISVRPTTTKTTTVDCGTRRGLAAFAMEGIERNHGQPFGDHVR